MNPTALTPPPAAAGLVAGSLEPVAGEQPTDPRPGLPLDPATGDGLPATNLADLAAVYAGAIDVAIIHTEALAWMMRQPSETFDAVVTDPPYSSGGAFRGDRTQTTDSKYVGTEQAGMRPDFAGDNRDQRGFAKWCALWLSEALRICKPGSPICVFSDWRQLPTAADMLQTGGWVWRGIAVWDKTEGCRPFKGRFRAQCEYVVWGSAGAMPPGDASANKPVLPGCFRHPVKQADKHHQTGKPTPLMEDILRIVPPGGLILDPFAGSGTTLVAARRTGRRAIGLDILPNNVQTTRRRLATTPRPLPIIEPADPEVRP